MNRSATRETRPPVIETAAHVVPVSSPPVPRSLAPNLVGSTTATGGIDSRHGSPSSINRHATVEDEESDQNASDGRPFINIPGLFNPWAQYGRDDCSGTLGFNDINETTVASASETFDRPAAAMAGNPTVADSCDNAVGAGGDPSSSSDSDDSTYRTESSEGAYSEEESESDTDTDQDQDQDIPDEEQMEIIEEIQDTIAEEHARNRLRENAPPVRERSFYRNRKNTRRLDAREMSTLGLGDIASRYGTMPLRGSSFTNILADSGYLELVFRSCEIGVRAAQRRL